MLNLVVDAQSVQRLGERLGSFTGKTLTELSTEAVNEVAERTYDLSRQTVKKYVNLSSAYVDRRMQLSRATPGPQPRAVITALAGGTVLGHYGAVQTVKPVTWTNARITGMGKKFSPWPGWVKRTGDKVRGIPVDTKDAGISVAVSSKGRKVVRSKHGDTFALVKNGIAVKDSEGNPLIVRRTGLKTKRGTDELQALYGPAVYQLFRTTINVIQNDVTDDLGDTLVRYAEEALDRVVK